MMPSSVDMAKVEILCHERCELGEGPFYCERRDTLFWFDIVGRKRHAYDFANSRKSVLPLPEMASAMAVVDDNTDLLLTQSGLWTLNSNSGAFSPIASIEADNEITRSNDARVHNSGAFWISTMGLSAESEAGAIYHYRKGVVSKLFDKITIPNAICFSPDGARAYFTDTVTAKLMAVAVDVETGLPKAEPEIFIDHGDNPGGLDGAITDADGNIWIALWGASEVRCYSPLGELKSNIIVPATQPSCGAFTGGGKIAVTTAWQGMDELQKAQDVNAGKTLLLDVNARAKFEPRVAV